MAGSQYAAESSDSDGEVQPLLRALPRKNVTTLCTLSIVALLTLTWCVVDMWNRDVSTQLFSIGDMKKMRIDRENAKIEVQSMPPFEFPLTLAFMQFAFMGLVFLALWYASTKNAASDRVKVWSALKDTKDAKVRWGGLVGTHILSTFWLQALMVPANVMSLPAFATLRMVEVPATAWLRGQVMGNQIGTRPGTHGAHPLAAVAMMSGAAWLLTYSYTQIAECICVFSGHGVALSGIPFYLIFGLICILPAANAVCQEAVMVQLDTPFFLLLAVQNILACMLFVPVLFGAHLFGWESVGLAFSVTAANQETYMLVLSLCVQMALISAVTLGLIYMVDSFWTVALRSLRVAYHTVKILFFFSVTSETLLSIAHPHQALWAFVMLFGILIAGVAAVLDQKAHSSHLASDSKQAALTNDALSALSTPSSSLKV